MKAIVSRTAILKLVRWFSWLLLAIMFLLLALIFALRIPSIQNMVTQKAITFLKERIKTEVTLESIYIAFPKKIVLTKLYLEDQSKDTLLYTGKLSVDANLWALLQKRIEINKTEIEDGNIHVSRAKSDSTFNFNYIVEAFSSDAVTEKKQDTISSAWAISIEKVELSKISLVFADSFSGNDVRTRLGYLNLVIHEFDPGRMVFSIKSIELADTYARVIQNPERITEELSDTLNSNPAISFSSIDFNNVSLDYSNLATGQHVRSHIGEFILDAKIVSLEQKLMDIGSLELRGSELTYHQDKRDRVRSNTSEQTASTNTEFLIPWNIQINELKLSNNSLNYDDDNFDSLTTSAIDFNHLHVSNLTLDADKMAARGSRVEATVENFAFAERKGFNIQSMSSHVTLTRHELILESFILKSPHSNLVLESRVVFPSLNSLGHSTIDLRIKTSTIALKDLLYFSPVIPDSIPIELDPYTILTLESELKGSFDDLTINYLHLKTLSGTIVMMEGKITGITKPASGSVAINLKKFRTTRRDVESIVNDSLLESIHIPDWIEITGRYRGRINAPSIEGYLTSSDGNIRVNGKFDFDLIPSYDAQLKTEQLNVGKIFKQQGMAGLTMAATIRGFGVSSDSIDATINLLVENFIYNQYAYKDFKLNGLLHNYLFAGNASLHDENLDFTLTGDFNYSKENPLYALKVELTNADFKKLNLSERPIRARGKLDLNMATRDFRVMNGKMAIRKVAIFNGESLYTVDSLLFASVDQEGESNLTIESDILSGEFKGSFNLFKIGGVLKQHLNQYFSLQDRKVKDFETPQQFTFNLTLKNTGLISEILIPELEFIPGKIEGEFDSEANQLHVEVGVSQITYSKTTVDSISILIDSDEEALYYKVRAKDFKLDTIRIDAAQLTGTVDHDSIQTIFKILNSKNKEKYVLGGVIKSSQDGHRLHILQDQLWLDYINWNIPSGNYLNISERGLTAHNFLINNGQERLALVTASKDSTISVEFHQFQLSNLTRLARGVMLANGTINGNLKFSSSNQGVFNSKLNIDRLEILEKPFGNVVMELAHATSQYVVNLEIQDSVTRVSVAGKYSSPKGKPTIDLSVTLAPLNLSLIEPISLGQLTHVKGISTGNLKVSGTLAAPSIQGNIAFQNASFRSTYLNSNFRLANEKIAFDGTGVLIDHVTIQDDKKNKAVINGSILTTDYREFRLNLNVSAKNFLVLNTTKDDNELYYGKVRINTAANITGNATRPRIDMNASFSKGSEFTYVVPQKQKTVAEQQGIVQFVDHDATNDPFLRNLTIADTVQASFTGINLSSTLELTEEEILNIIIDPVAGDKLSVKGNANLTYNMSTSGNISLSGRYEVSEGTYQMSLYKFIRRKFDIEKGGTITWAGNPLHATLDLRASYKVDTSPFDLISNQLKTTDQSELNSYKQRLPFLVYLNLNGQMLSPKVSFQLGMPVDKRGAFGGSIYAKLNDINTRESDVNKQVFALLILKRFVSDNPLEGNGGGIESTARASASRLLSDQLNRLSENVKGLELSFDVKSYQGYGDADGGETQVQLGVSKSLFNDRLVVKLSGNVDVEGESNQQEDATDYIGDIALEYKLTRDGRFRVTGFRTGNYDMIDGELTETGVGLIYIKDYDTLRELFKRNAKRK